MILKLARSFNTRFLLTFILCGMSWTPQAHAEQSALEARLQRKVNQLSVQLVATSTPNASLREELLGLMRDGAALFDVPFNELTYQGKLQNGSRALVALANAYTQKTKDPFMDNGPEGFLKLISEQNVFHPEKIEYIGLAARAYPHLGGSSGLQITNLVSRLLFEKAIESAPYESKHLDEALLLLNSAYPLADGREGTKDYYQTLFLTLSSLNHEESLKTLTTSLRSQQAKDPKHFGWVEGFLSSLETSLEETLKEALYQKEEIDLALRSIHEMNSGCTKEETEEAEETVEALKPSGNFLKDRQLGILKEELRSENTHRQLRALKALAKFEASRILETLEGGELFKELQDTFRLLDNASAMHICITLLHKNSTRKKEVEALRDPDKDVRLWAVTTLGYFLEESWFGEKEASKEATIIPALIESLTDEDKEIRLEVAKVLRWIKEKATPAIPALIEALKDPDRDVRRQAAVTLGWLGEEATPAIPAFIKALTDSDEEVRHQADRNLSSLWRKGAPVVSALIEALKDPDKNLHRPAVIILRHIGDKAAVPALIEALKDPDKDLRRQVALALGIIREKADLTIPALIEALRDPDKGVRGQAAKVLGWFGEKAVPAIPALIEALRDPDKDLRLGILWTLSSFGEKAAPALPALTQIIFQEGEDYFNRQEAINALKKIGPNALPVLHATFRAHPDPKIRIQAREAISRILESLKAAQ